MPIVNVEGKGRVNFPAGMSKEDMTQAIYKKWPDLMPRTGAQKVGDFATSALRGAVQPFMDLGAGVETLTEKGLGSLGIPGLKYAGGVQAPDLTNTARDPTVAKLAGLASGFLLPEAKIAQGLGYAGKLAKLGDMAATGAGYAGTMAAGTGGDVGRNALLGAALPLALHGAVNAPLIGGKAIANKVVKGLEQASNRAGSDVKSPAEVARMLPSLEGVNIPIQNVANGGYLKNLASEMGALPFSGVVNPAQTAVHKTDEMANAVFNSIGGAHAPEEINPLIHQALNESERKATENNGNLYRQLAEEGKKAGVKAEIPGLQQKAQEVVDNYKNSPIPEAHPLHNEKFLLNMLGSIKKGYVPDLESEYMIGQEKPVADMMHMVNLQQAIGKYYGSIKNKEGREAAAGLAKHLYGLAGKDLEDTIEKSANPHLSNLLSKAKQDYKDNVLPYRETDIKKRLGETDTAEIANVLLNPKNKGAAILGHLPEQTRQMILSQALKPAVEANVADAQFNTTPHKLLSKFNDLKKKNATSFNQLVSPEVQRTFQKLNDLHESTKGLRAMANKPETGVQVKPILYGAGLEGGAAALLGSLGLSHPAGLMAGPAIAYGNRQFQKLLRDPKLLEAYAAGRGANRENALNAIFGGRKSKVIKGAAKVLSNPGAIATMINSGGNQ